MKTNRNKRVMQKRTTAESHHTFGAKRRIAVSFREVVPRLLRVVAVVAVGAGAAYFLQKQLIDWLFGQIGEQPFAYTTYGQLGLLPALYLTAGLILGLPVLLFHSLKLWESRFAKGSTPYFLALASLSAVLTAAGVYFGYYYGLPLGLSFLAGQFMPDPAAPLNSVYAYVQFSSLYLLASAVAFQVPLVLYIVNQLKLLSLRSMIDEQRWAVMASLVVGAMINPSADILAMLAIALLMLSLYQVAIATVWLTNRSSRYRTGVVGALLMHDEEEQARRLRQLGSAFITPVLEPVPVAAPNNDEPLSQVAAVSGGMFAQTPSTVPQPVRAEPAVSPEPVQAEPAVPLVSAPTVPMAPPAESPAPTAGSTRQEPSMTVNGIRRRIY